MNVKHVQAEIKILAQLAVGHGLLGFFVGRGEHAHVHRRFHFAAQAPHFVVLQHAQQFGLRRRGHFADFVEQQRAAVGQLEAADAPLGRAGEGAALMAENFALHQRFGNRRAIDGDEGTVGARRKLMDGARQNFLARAGFAGDQHGGGGGRDLLDDAHHVLHGLGAAHQIADAPGFAQLARQRGHLLLVAGAAQGAVQQGVQNGALERLFDVPEGAGFDGGDGALFAALAGDDDGGDGLQVRRPAGRAESGRPCPATPRRRSGRRARNSEKCARASSALVTPRTS